MRTALLMVVVGALLWATASVAEIYSWTDKSGTTHIADDILKVPPEYQEQAKARQIQDEESAPPTRNKRKDSQAAASKEKKSVEKSSRAGTEPTDKYGRGEEYWRDRADCLRDQLSELKEDYESVIQQEQECEKHSFDYRGKRPDCSIYAQQKSQYERAIERYKKALEVDLPDEARKAEAYPGWLR